MDIQKACEWFQVLWQVRKDEEKMNFWNSHDLILIELRKKAISLIEEFEGKNNRNNKNYHKNLNNLINTQLGKQVKIFTTLSTAYTLKGIPHFFVEDDVMVNTK